MGSDGIQARSAGTVTASAVSKRGRTAYPIPPKPLWPLTAEAELIVVAEVTAVEPLPHDDESWDSAVAHLQILETLKGPRLDAVRVPFPKTLVCPAPPRYAEGETVVAFLARRAEAWKTVSLSYGTLYPEGGDLEDVTTMVRAAVDLKSQALAPEELALQKRDWLVHAASLSGTRWHGLSGLSSGSGSPRWAGHDGSRPRFDLEPRHRTLLARAFIEAPKIDRTLPMMLRLLDGYGDPAVDLAAITVLEELLGLEAPPGGTSYLLEAVLVRWGDTHTQSALKDLGTEMWFVPPEQLRRIWLEGKDPSWVLGSPQ